MSTVRSNTFLKLAADSLIAILGLWIFYTLLFGNGYVLNSSIGWYHGGGGIYMGTGLAITLPFILMFLIKALSVLFLVGLVLGIAIAIKNVVFPEEDVVRIKGEFNGKKTIIIKEACDICGKELENDWVVCPHCGKSK